MKARYLVVAVAATCMVIVVCTGFGRVIVVDGVEELRRSGASKYPKHVDELKFTF